MVFFHPSLHFFTFQGEKGTKEDDDTDVDCYGIYLLHHTKQLLAHVT